MNKMTEEVSYEETEVLDEALYFVLKNLLSSWKYCMYISCSCISVLFVHMYVCVLLYTYLLLLPQPYTHAYIFIYTYDHLC